MIRGARYRRVSGATSGFTLLDFGIVLLIIGLIAGGIFIGSALFETSKLQKIMSDKAQMLSAVNTYKSKYSALPGDHGRAESVFGSSATDNGNDNGVVDLPTANNDSWLFWQHLALAQLWKGSFTGDNGVNNPNNAWDAVIGVNVPPAPRSGTGYSIYYDPADTSLGNTPRQHFIVVGGDLHSNNVQTFGAWLSPAGAYGLDVKYDDGVGNSGDVRTVLGMSQHGSTNCTTGSAPNHDYNVTNDSAFCNLLLMFEP